MKNWLKWLENSGLEYTVIEDEYCITYNFKNNIKVLKYKTKKGFSNGGSIYIDKYFRGSFSSVKLLKEVLIEVLENVSK